MNFAPDVAALVVGSPIGHSLSPAMHNAEFRRRGESRIYVAHEVPSGGLRAFIESLRGGNIAGLSVTMPLKDEAYELVDRRDAASSRCGSVNTISFDDGVVSGWNTDGDGCVRALESSGKSVADSTCVVLGAGGTGRAVVEALGRRGAREVVVVNRTPEGARRAASCADVGVVGSPNDVERADFLVNTTPVGMQGISDEDVPVDTRLVPRDCVVLDAVYSPLITPMLAALGERGVTTVDGLWMLVYQAALQQEIWFGFRPDVAVMRAAAEAELARR
ncbi:MAG: shikimate dehydrogenase [Actinomycetota bacterium]